MIVYNRTAIICIITSFLYSGSIYSQINSLTTPGMPLPESVGYIVLSNGDTIPGLIKWQLKYVENNLSEISFTALNYNSKILPAGEILAFGYRGYYDKYESVPSLKKSLSVYMYRFLDGRIKIFLNRSSGIPLGRHKSDITTGLFSFDAQRGMNIGKIHIPADVFNICADARNFLVLKENGELRKINKDNYIEAFSELFSDCPEIMNEADKYPEMKDFVNFVIVTAAYNNLYRYR